MTNTATALGNGPFAGFVDEVLTTLFELDPPFINDGTWLQHVVVSNMPEDDDYPAETCIFAARRNGALDIGYYQEHGTVLNLVGDVTASEVVTMLGYVTQPTLAEA
jgi:hypothetical protein